MNFSNYFKQLLPTFGRDRAVEDARVVRNELVGVTIPSYELAMEAFKTNVSSKRAQGFAKQYKLMVGNHKNTFVFDILERMKKLVKVLDAIDSELAKNFENKVVTEAMDVRKANVLRALESIGFISKFSLSLLNVIYVDETAAYGKTQPISSDVQQGEYARIERFFIDFCALLKSLTDAKDPAKSFADIPDVQADGIEQLRDVFSDDRIDPFGLFTKSNFKGNPIYFVRTVMVDWQMDRYKHTQEQKKLLELRLLHLQRRMQNNPDASTERDIEATSSRVASLAEKLRKVEESFA